MTTLPDHVNNNLETFQNPEPGRDYTIHFEVPEFTCLCPLTGQPDFAQLFIAYVPDRLCVELKSLKNYVWSFRNKAAFHEAVSNEILNDLCALLKPRFLRLTAEFNVRGGIATSIVVEQRMEGWESDELIEEVSSRERKYPH